MTDRTRYLLMQDVVVKNGGYVSGYLWEPDDDISFYRGEPGVYKWLERAARENWPTFQVLEPPKPIEFRLDLQNESKFLPERVTFRVDYVR